MLHPVPASLRHLCRAITGVAVLVVLLASPARAEQPSQACSLLQTAELEAALAEKASTKPSGSKDNAGGMVLDHCSVTFSQPGRKMIRTVDISIVSELPMPGTQGIVMRNAGTAREQQWKSPGARLEQKTFGKTICIMAGRPHVAGNSICSIPRGNGYVEVNVTASVEDLVSLDTVRMLVEKAVTRL